MDIGLNREEEIKGKVSCRELNKLGFSDDDIRNQLNDHVKEIMSYTGESLQEVAYKINNSIEQGHSLWGELKPDDEKGLFGFHSTTTRKIYSMTGICDYLATIREKAIRRMRKPAHILDFGGSHGHFSIAAAQAGFEVTYADIGLEVRKFVEWRMKQRNLNINFATIENNRCIIKDRYDYIVCLDVISHLPDLPRYMKDFYNWLKDDGELYLGDDLYDFLVPWHLGENKIYCDPEKKNELFSSFRFIDHLWANCDIWGK